MKKVTAMICFALCAMLHAPCSFAAPVQILLGLSVDVSRIQFKGLSYTPSAVVTNHSTEWVTVIEVRTNEFYGFKPDEVVTNSVQKQVAVSTTTLHLAYWTTSFDYSIPAGTVLLIGGALSTTPSRRVDLPVRMVLTPAQLTAILGSQLYDQTLTAAQLFGTLPVSGSMEAALQAAVQSALAGGAQ